MVDDFDASLREHASKSGVSQRALRRARGNTMAHIAPVIRERLSSCMPAKERLREKILCKSHNRLSKSAKETNYERTRESVRQSRPKDQSGQGGPNGQSGPNGLNGQSGPNDQRDKERKERKARVARRKKLKEVESRVGKVTERMLAESLLKMDDNSLRDDERRKHRNIVDLYAKQNSFTESINLDEDLADLI